VLLDADGMVTRRTVDVASPWPDARVREIDVRPGDWVEAGQKIAVVESATMSRSLADLAAEQARVQSRLAQLEARRSVVTTLIPVARVSAKESEAFLSTLKSAKTRGMVVSKSLQQMSAANVEAMDKLLTLEAEETSLKTEIKANQDALEQLSGAWADLQQNYAGGVLTAPATGYVGSRVAMVGEVLNNGAASVANIYTGPSYVLAYIPENYLFDIEEGQLVSVKGRGAAVTGNIERVLPVTEALPPEFQLPNRVRGRGQVVRVSLAGDANFAIDEKINLTSCYLENCRLGVRRMIQTALPGIFRSKRSAEAPRQEMRDVPVYGTKVGPQVLIQMNAGQDTCQPPLLDQAKNFGTASQKRATALSRRPAQLPSSADHLSDLLEVALVDANQVPEGRWRLPGLGRRDLAEINGALDLERPGLGVPPAQKRVSRIATIAANLGPPAS
jgi:multidrug resistance efflux pump